MHCYYVKRTSNIFKDFELSGISMCKDNNSGVESTIILGTYLLKYLVFINVFRSISCI
jgi:hypothetical protein